MRFKIFDFSLKLVSAKPAGKRTVKNALINLSWNYSGVSDSFASREHIEKQHSGIFITFLRRILFETNF